MRVEMVPEQYRNAKDLNPVQYEEDFGFPGEHLRDMTKRGGTMDGFRKPSDDYFRQVEAKVVHSTAKTERFNKEAPASKAFNTLAKSGYKAMPNNNGSGTVKGIYKPGAERR